jgi:hypothetical protein
MSTFDKAPQYQTEPMFAKVKFLENVPSSKINILIGRSNYFITTMHSKQNFNYSRHIIARGGSNVT